MRQTVRVAYVPSFEESYHVGTYRYLVGGDTLSDYRARVTITPEDDSVIDDIGLMFRYRGPNDYYRISQSARHGYTRLEKRRNGVFSTLGVNAIGYEPGQATTYEVEAVGSELWVWIDGELIFAVADGVHARGSIALYTQDAVRFDDVSVTEPSTAPLVALRSTGSQAVIPGTTLRVEAAALNAPTGSEVVIEVDGYAPRRLTSPPYVVTLEQYRRRNTGSRQGCWTDRMGRSWRPPRSAQWPSAVPTRWRSVTATPTVSGTDTPPTTGW